MIEAPDTIVFGVTAFLFGAAFLLLLASRLEGDK